MIKVQTVKVPCFMYKSPGSIRRARYTYSEQYADTKEKAEYLLNYGWYFSVEDAASKIKDIKEYSIIEDDLIKDSSLLNTEVLSSKVSINRAFLENQAIELGIKFDGRTSDEKLQQRVEEALINRNE